MRDLILFIADYETVIYFFLGISGLVLLYQLFMLWQEAREARFGLERESSQRRINQKVISLFYIFIIVVVVFVSVTYVKPNLPIEISDSQSEVGQTSLDDGAVEEQPGSLEQPVILPTVDFTENSCDKETINISSPFTDQEVRGEIDVEGTVNVEDFGFYKFEITTINDPLWITIQAGREQMIDGVLLPGWDTSRFIPGEYFIRLVVSDSENEEYPACIVPIRISPPVE